MVINGINSRRMNSSFNYQSAVSQIKLHNALASNTRYQQTLRPVEPVAKVDLADGSSSMDFIKSYHSSMSDLLQSSNALRQSNRTGVMNDMEVISSDASVAEAKERYTIRSSKDIAVHVEQTASAQENVSEGIASSAQAALSMEFSISDSRGRQMDVAVSQNFEDGSPKTNEQMLKEAAAQINRQSNVGVKAYIEEKEGISALKLKGTKTGEGNSFHVSGNLGAASGLDQVFKAAEDAVYSVNTDGNVVSKRSSTNDVAIDNGRIGLNLKSQGDVTVSARPDHNKVISAVEDFTDSFNNALKLLKDNAQRGTGAASQLKNMVMGFGSGEALAQVGISTREDGSMTLDKDVLKKKLEDDPKLTKEALGGSYSVAQTGFHKASQAMGTSAGSLINHDIKAAQNESSSNAINFMNIYSRSGAYNMNNYNALGLMINYLA